MQNNILFSDSRRRAAAHSNIDGTLMAKRETNAQRTAREYNRRTTLQMADWVAKIICTRRENKADLAPEHLEDLPAKELKRMGWVPESKDWRKKYTFLGQVFCELCPFDENPATFLRLVADRVEGKQPYSTGAYWNDGEITTAYGEAIRRMPRPRVTPDGIVEGTLPSFSEFLDVFREQNPKLFQPRHNRPGGIASSERSLRRSLKRLGYRTEPAKPGRPKKNKDRKPPLTR
jgi:hypothetical protein